MIAAFDVWEGAPIIVGIVLIAIIVFSIMRPSGRVRIGLFFERKHFDPGPKDEPPAAPPSEAPTKGDKDAW